MKLKEFSSIMIRGGMVTRGKIKAVLYSMKSSVMLILLLISGSNFLILCSCTGTSSNRVPDLAKSWPPKEEIPNDPNFFSDLLCKAAGEQAEKSGFNPPMCLYTSPEGKIKVMPGGRLSLKNTPRGTSLVIMLVNTGVHPIRIGEKMLNTGEVAIWEKYGNTSIIEKDPNIILKAK